MDRKNHYRPQLEHFEGRVLQTANRAVMVGVLEGNLAIAGTANDDLIQVMDANNGTTPVYRIKQTYEGQTRIIADVPTAQVTGNAVLFMGFEGNDYFKYTTSRTKVLDVVADGGLGKDTIWGYSGNDVLIGGEQDDHLYGWEGHDLLLGQAGNDTLKGGTGNDCLIGGIGGDEIYGEYGEDLLVAGQPLDYGNIWGMYDNDLDRLDGGPGRDNIYGSFSDVYSPTERYSGEINYLVDKLKDDYSSWHSRRNTTDVPRRVEIIDVIGGRPVVPHKPTKPTPAPWGSLVEPFDLDARTGRIYYRL